MPKKIFEQNTGGKFVIYVGNEKLVDAEPVGKFFGSAVTNDGAKELSKQWPNGQLYRRETIVRYTPVKASDIPND